MNAVETKKIANDWVAAWNKRDLVKIMEHYDDDVELCSPFVVKRWEIATGNLSGKLKVQEHFAKAFENVDFGNIELLEILAGVSEFLLIFGTTLGPTSANLVVLNEAGKVKSVKAYYLN